MNHSIRRLQLLWITGLCLLINVANAQHQNSLKKAGIKKVDELSTQIHYLSQKLWDFSETALKENQSAQLLVDVLEKEGFSVERNIAGMPTAFVAIYGEGEPTIGILAEYDALPGVGNTNVPFRQKRNDGITAGQGCGHNLFGSACVNAAIAIKELMNDGKIKGTIKLFGTPAEETVVGKVYMAKEGIFNGLDAVLEWHPGDETSAGYGKSLAMNNFQVEFFGQAAHGAADPWNGRSALDAVEMMNYGVNLFREHIYPTTRIHYVIPNGGEAPNVVPEYAKVWYYVRDTSRANVDKFYERILKIAEGAALATNTEYKISLITGVHQYNLNEPLITAVDKNLKMIGPPLFTEEEQKWAKELQKNTQKEEKGFITTIKEIPPDWKTRLPEGGSTDVAEVSFIAPTVGFRIATAPYGVPWHSWATTASHGTKAAYKGAEIAAKVLTITAIDLYTDQGLLQKAKDYFMKQTGGQPYVSPLPREQQVMLPAQD